MADKSAPEKRYEPNHPHADKDGYVLYPNINAMTEMSNVMSATRSYEANLQAVSMAKDVTENIGNTQVGEILMNQVFIGPINPNTI